jgi:hypothetical protein
MKNYWKLFLIIGTNFYKNQQLFSMDFQISQTILNDQNGKTINEELSNTIENNKNNFYSTILDDESQLKITYEELCDEIKREIQNHCAKELKYDIIIYHKGGNPQVYSERIENYMKQFEFIKFIFDITKNFQHNIFDKFLQSLSFFINDRIIPKKEDIEPLLNGIKNILLNHIDKMYKNNGLLKQKLKNDIRNNNFPMLEKFDVIHGEKTQLELIFRTIYFDPKIISFFSNINNRLSLFNIQEKILNIFNDNIQIIRSPYVKDQIKENRINIIKTTIDDYLRLLNVNNCINISQCVFYPNYYKIPGFFLYLSYFVLFRRSSFEIEIQTNLLIGFIISQTMDMALSLGVLSFYFNFFNEDFKFFNENLNDSFIFLAIIYIVFQMGKKIVCGLPWHFMIPYSIKEKVIKYL